MHFNRVCLTSTLERVLTDPGFSRRRAAWVRTFIALLVSLRVHHMFRLLPAACQPVIDCAIARVALGSR